MPRGATTVPPECSPKKIVLISGCVPIHARASRFHSRHVARPGCGMTAVAAEYGQLVCVTERARQPLAFTRAAIAERQCDAWLSPMSATVRTPGAAAAPNAHARTRPRFSTTAQGELSILGAWTGVGTTVRRSSGLMHVRRGSRVAAPKQGGLAARVRAVTCASARI